MRSIWLLSVAGAGLSLAAALPTGDIEQIVQRSTKEVVADWNQAPHYSFVERDVESKRDGRSTIKTYQVLMIDGSPYNRLVSLGDQPLSAAENAEEARKLSNEIRKRQHESEAQRAKRIQKYTNERQQDRALLNAMVDAFSFKLAGEESVDGHNCWVLDASPKPGYHPVSRETKVLAGMRGRMWIDKASGQWVKVQAEVTHTVSFYGFFAKVRPGTRFLLEQQPVADKLWLPKHFQTQVSASVLGFVNEDSVSDETYSNYQPVSQALAELGTR